MYFNTSAYLSNLAEANVKEYDYRQAASDGNWLEWQQQFRDKLRHLLGMQYIGANTTALNPRLHETKTTDTYIREKWSILTEPGVEIPFYLLIPTHGQGPYPLVITPHGHGRRGKEVYVGNFENEEEQISSLEGDRDIALQAVAEGYAVIAPDVRGFWEMAREEEMIKPKVNNSCAELQRSAMMHGRTLIGERVHDMGRLIDYAQTRTEIDASRIVITGNSGGGTVSLFTAALDERISISVPGSYFCTFEQSIVSLSHCACNLIPGVMNSGEMYDIAGLISPRPILIVHGVEDRIYPIEGTREAFAHLQEIYQGMGHPDRCELYEGQGGHRYYKERVWDFVREWL